jgi:hypothetical protein
MLALNRFQKLQQTMRSMCRVASGGRRQLAAAATSGAPEMADTGSGAVQGRTKLMRLPKQVVRTNLQHMLRAATAAAAREGGDASSAPSASSTSRTSARGPMTRKEAAKIKLALYDAQNVGDHTLSAQLVQQLVESPWSAGEVAPDVLTVCMQLYEAGGLYDRALHLYQQNREADNVNARHLTSALRVLKVRVCACVCISLSLSLSLSVSHALTPTFSP